jgi:hypothetical protein
MKLDHDEFAAFWLCYPRREAKINAMKAYVQARKLASAEDILAGVERYKRTMPAERQYRPLPASWLNAGRWMDEDDEPLPRVERRECPHQPRCNSKTWCEVLIDRAAEGWHRDPETGKWTQRTETV